MSRYEEIKKTIECAKGNCVTRLNFDTMELDYLIDIIEKQREALRFYGEGRYLRFNPMKGRYEPIEMAGKIARTALKLTDTE